MDEKRMVETFQCPGCTHGENTGCGWFKLREFRQPESSGGDDRPPAGFQCKHHRSGAKIRGLAVNIGLPVPMARVRFPVGDEQVRTTIRMYLDPENGGSLWDDFNVPVWALQKGGFLFVRTYAPRIDRSSIDVVQGGTIGLVRTAFPQVIDVTAMANTMDL